MYSYRVY